MKILILTMILIISFSNVSFSQKFTTFIYPQYCHRIHCDQENNIWYGGDNGFDVKYELTLFKYDGYSWEGIKLKEDQSVLNCIISGPEGYVYFNTQSEIIYIANDQWKWLKLSASSQENLMFDKNNKLLFSSKEQEYVTDFASNFQTFLYEYDFQTKIVRIIRDYGKYSTLNDAGRYEKTILDYINDKDGNLYMMEIFRSPINALLTKYDGNKFENINMPVDVKNKNSFYYTIKIAIHEGILVFYYYYSKERIHKLYHYDNHEWIRKEIDLSALMYEKVKEMKFDNNGVLWFASGIGVFFIKDDQFMQFTEDDGLLSNNCTDLDFDKYGNVWVAHEIGVTKIEDPYSSVKDTGYSEDCYIFPNPTDNIAYLHHNIPLSQNLYVEVFSSEGILQRRFETQYEHTIEINIANFSSGLYIVNISNGIIQNSFKLIIL